MGEWKEIRLGELVKGIRGVSYKPENLLLEKEANSYELLRSTNIQDGHTHLENVQTVESKVVSDKQRLNKGDIVVCMSNGSKRLVGKSAIFNSEGDYCVGAFCSSFTSDNSNNKEFAFWLFQSDEYQKQIDVELAGSAINNLKNSSLEEFTFNIPTNPAEQQKIAQILTKADEAIQQTERLIAKYQAIRTGLMQDLLTRGIDEAGNVRSEETHAFKDSELGRIPVEWSVKSIENITEMVGSGVTPKGGSEVYLREGIPFIRSQNVYPDGLRLSDVAYIDPLLHNKMRRTHVRQFDVLLNITGASIGRCTLMFATTPANVNQHVCILRLKCPKKENAILLSSLLNSHFGQNQIAAYNAGSNREGLNFQQAKEMIFALPKKQKEIKRLAEMITASETPIVSLRKDLRKAIALKTALMQDLLTGKKRVDDVLK